MTPDVEGMLRRVVRDVFAEDTEDAWDIDARRPHVRVTLRAQRGSEWRTVDLSASGSGLLDITIPDLGISAALFEYDDPGYMESILRELALVADAYLSGEDRIDEERGMLRRRPVMRIAVNGNDWSLGRRTSTVHYPLDSSTERSND